MTPTCVLNPFRDDDSTTSLGFQCLTTFSVGKFFLILKFILLWHNWRPSPPVLFLVTQERWPGFTFYSVLWCICKEQWGSVAALKQNKLGNLNFSVNYSVPFAKLNSGMVQALVSSNQQPQNLNVASSGWDTPSIWIRKQNQIPFWTRTQKHTDSQVLANGEFQNLKVH